MIEHQYLTDQLRAKLTKLPDLEKQLAKVFADSVKHSVKAIYFEDVNLAKMKDFRVLLKVFKDLSNILEGFRNVSDELKSTRLASLVNFQSDCGLVPDNINQAIEEF